jgi:hypothetical protein
MRRLLLFLLIALLAAAMPMFLRAADEPIALGSGHGYLIDKHVEAHIGCAACHVEKPPAKEPEMTRCLGCHGGSYADLAAITASDAPNPHASHLGAMPCSSCHHVHKASVTYCNSCHTFDMTMP